MRDVARLAGVATMTVSRVINGNAHVSEETRQRVFAAIAKLNYRPNTLARSLREQRSRQIGIIVPNIHDPFFAVCAQAVSIVAKEHAYSVNIAMSDEEPKAEYHDAIRMMQRNVEGLVVIPSAGSITYLTDSEFSRLPIVTLDRPLACGHFDSVVVKNAEGAELAVEHLIQHGHQRIAYIALSLELYTMRERHSGYLRAMHKANLPAEIYCRNFTQAELLETLEKILRRDNPVTAIFCGNNLTTRNALHGMAALGVKVPDQVALIGFDDFEIADLLDPAITVVSQPSSDMGRRGAQLLFSRITRKHERRAAEQVVLPVELIVRDSCGRH
jgi:LacI family transcriptional regulator